MIAVSVVIELAMVEVASEISMSDPARYPSASDLGIAPISAVARDASRVVVKNGAVSSAGADDTSGVLDDSAAPVEEISRAMLVSMLSLAVAVGSAPITPGVVSPCPKLAIGMLEITGSSKTEEAIIIGAAVIAGSSSIASALVVCAADASDVPDITIVSRVVSVTSNLIVVVGSSALVSCGILASIGGVPEIDRKSTRLNSSHWE